MLALMSPPCGDDLAITARIEKHLGRQVEEGRVEAQIETERHGERIWARVSLDVDGRRYTRELEGESCEAVLDATALLATALLARPSGWVPEAPPEADEEPPPEDEPASDADVEPVAEPFAEAPQVHVDERWPSPETPSATQEPARPRPEDDPEQPRGRVGGGAFAGASFGVLPRPAARVGLEAVYERGRALIAVAAAYHAPRATRGPDDALVQLFSGGLRGCAAFGRDLGGGPCAVARVGGMRARLRAPQRGADTVAWMGIGPGLHLRWHVAPRMTLYAAGAALAGVVRPRFEFGVSDGGERVVHEASVWTGYATVGITFFFRPR